MWNFVQVYLKRMFSTHNLLPIDYETRFFVAVDPAAGGEKSDFAVVSFLVFRGIYQVIMFRIFINCHAVIRIRVKS